MEIQELIQQTAADITGVYQGHFAVVLHQQGHHAAAERVPEDNQFFACLPNHVVGKGVIKQLKKAYPQANIVAVDYDPGASEVNQLNRIKLMLSTAKKNLEG